MGSSTSTYYLNPNSNQSENIGGKNKSTDNINSFDDSIIFNRKDSSLKEITVWYNNTEIKGLKVIYKMDGNDYSCGIHCDENFDENNCKKKIQNFENERIYQVGVRIVDFDNNSKRIGSIMIKSMSGKELKIENNDGKAFLFELSDKKNYA